MANDGLEPKVQKIAEDKATTVKDPEVTPEPDASKTENTEKTEKEEKED